LRILHLNPFELYTSVTGWFQLSTPRFLTLSPDQVPYLQRHQTGSRQYQDEPSTVAHLPEHHLTISFPVQVLSSARQDSCFEFLFCSIVSMQCAWMIRHDCCRPSSSSTAARPGGSRVALCQGAKAEQWEPISERRPGFPGWSRGDSNPGPPPCKGGALPAKLRPPKPKPSTHPLVGAPGLEPGTSALSGPRSDQLSYAPQPSPDVVRANNTAALSLAF
jgi:hypothetical protein